MVDFGEMARGIKEEAEAQKQNAGKRDDGPAVLTKKVLPLLNRARDEIEKEKIGVSCSIETPPGGKSLVVFTCQGTSVGTPDAGSFITSVPVHFESDGNTIDARVQGSETPFSGPVRDFEDIINSAIEAALWRFNKLRLRGF